MDDTSIKGKSPLLIEEDYSLSLQKDVSPIIGQFSVFKYSLGYFISYVNNVLNHYNYQERLSIHKPSDKEIIIWNSLNLLLRTYSENYVKRKLNFLHVRLSTLLPVFSQRRSPFLSFNEWFFYSRTYLLSITKSSD